MSTSIEDLLEKLPSNYYKETDGNLANLLSVVLEEINEIEQAQNKVITNKKINEATGYSLDRIGKNVGQTRGGLDDESYRILIKAKIRANLSAGDINSLIEYIATILQVDRTEVEIKEPSWGSFHFSSKANESEHNNDNGFGSGRLREVNPEPASLDMQVPPETINSIPFSAQNLVNIIGKLCGAGIGIGLGIYSGTFAFSDINNQSEYDSDNGFDEGTLSAYYSPKNGKELPV